MSQIAEIAPDIYRISTFFLVVIATHFMHNFDR